MSRIITISREFGSGGRELGKRLADSLGVDYYDREIITAIAEQTGLGENYVEQILESHAWKKIPLNFRHSFANIDRLEPTQAGFLIEQKRVIEKIAKTGKDCVIVGRNADILLSDEKPFNMFVFAAAVWTGLKRESICLWRRWNRIFSALIKAALKSGRHFPEANGERSEHII